MHAWLPCCTQHMRLHLHPPSALLVWQEGREHWTPWLCWGHRWPHSSGHGALQLRTYFLAASLAHMTGWCPLVLLQQSQGDVGEHLQQLSSPSAAVRSWLLPLQPPTALGALQAAPITPPTDVKHDGHAVMSP